MPVTYFIPVTCISGVPRRLNLDLDLRISQTLSLLQLVYRKLLKAQLYEDGSLLRFQPYLLHYPQWTFHLDGFLTAQYINSDFSLPDTYIGYTQGK